MIVYFVLWLVLGLLALFVGNILYELWRRDRSMKRSGFVGIPGHPVLKNYKDFLDYKKVLTKCLEVQRNFGNRVRIDIFWGMCALQITDVKLAEFLLGTTHILNKGYNYKFFHKWLGMGLLTSTGETWMKSRKLLTPTFHFQILEQYVEVFTLASDVFIQKLRGHVGRGAFDVYPLTTLFTLDVICETAMGTKINAQVNSTSEYVTSVREICRIITERCITPIKVLELPYFFTEDYWKERRCLKVLRKHTNSVIQSRKEELEASGLTPEAFGRASKRRIAFLDLLLQCNANGEVLTDQEIREQVDTFMFEGHDTTASGISFTLYCLANNPKIQETVMDELNSIFGDDPKRTAAFQDLQEMKYLEMVIKESLRLYPPVPYFFREPQKDTEFDDGFLPYGAQLFIFAFGLHRDPEIYPEPEKFDPERFSPENQNNRNPFSYLTFSAGPRNCIGQKFAMLELKSTVSKILRNFEVLQVEGYHPQLVPLTILKSLNGIQIQLRERERSYTQK